VGSFKNCHLIGIGFQVTGKA